MDGRKARVLVFQADPQNVKEAELEHVFVNPYLAEEASQVPAAGPIVDTADGHKLKIIKWDFEFITEKELYDIHKHLMDVSSFNQSISFEIWWLNPEEAFTV